MQLRPAPPVPTPGSSLSSLHLLLLVARKSSESVTAENDGIILHLSQRRRHGGRSSTGDENAAGEGGGV